MPECEHEWQRVAWDYPIVEVCKKCDTMRGLSIRFPVVLGHEGFPKHPNRPTLDKIDPDA